MTLTPLRPRATTFISMSTPASSRAEVRLPPLTGKAVIEGGRLSDSLGLWRRLVCAEEAADRRRAPRRQKQERRQSR